MFDVKSPALVGLDETRLQRVGQWLDEQVSSQRLAGASVLIGRRGSLAYHACSGHADVASSKPFQTDTIARIYSMTKPITAVAAMMLYERGCFQLDHPVAKYLPEFAETPVWRGGSEPIEATEPQATPMLVKHLFSHTSGLTYGFMQATPVDAAYRAAGVEFAVGEVSLQEQVAKLAQIPLLCQPGTQWNYSVATDVLGRLVEVWSGLSLRDFFQKEILQPLSMVDTDFTVDATKQSRFASLYVPPTGGSMSGVGRKQADIAAPGNDAEKAGIILQESGSESRYLQPVTMHSGGGGLTGTIGDYGRFCQMLLNGGALDGVRLLSPITVNFMRTNQLPNNNDMAAMGQPVWSETSYDGIGFGLGVAVVLDPPKASIITSPGEFHWGGAASTFFWIDPCEDLFVVFFTQLVPSSTYPIRRELRARVYQAIVD